MKVYVVFFVDFDGEPQMAKGFFSKEKALDYVYHQNINSTFGWHYEALEVVE